MVREVLVIAAALSIQDVRERPRESENADELHRRLPFLGLISHCCALGLRERQQKTLSATHPGWS